MTTTTTKLKRAICFKGSMDVLKSRPNAFEGPKEMLEKVGLDISYVDTDEQLTIPGQSEDKKGIGLTMFFTDKETGNNIDPEKISAMVLKEILSMDIEAMNDYVLEYQESMVQGENNDHGFGGWYAILPMCIALKLAEARGNMERAFELVMIKFVQDALVDGQMQALKILYVMHALANLNVNIHIGMCDNTKVGFEELQNMISQNGASEHE